MTDFPMLASLAMFVLVTSSAFRHQNPLVLSLICGLMAALLTGGLLHVGAYTAPVTTLSLLGLGTLISSVLALEGSKTFTSSNEVLLSRDSFAGMTLSNATPVAHKAASHACAA